MLKFITDILRFLSPFFIILIAAYVYLLCTGPKSGVAFKEELQQRECHARIIGPIRNMPGCLAYYISCEKFYVGETTVLNDCDNKIQK